MCLAAMGFLVFATEAKANHSHPDSDGRIPLRWECENSNRLGWTSGSIVPKTAEIRRKIHINWCQIFHRGYGWRAVVYVYHHEMAHARGWDHWEGNPRKNAAYYPYYPRR